MYGKVYMREIPANIQELYEKNSALLETINFTPGRDDPLELCNPVAYYRTGLFTEDMVRSMFDGPEDTSVAPPDSIRQNIGMIVIRPDMVHANAQFETFIRARFTLLHQEMVVMDNRSYWQMYRHDLYRPETMHSRLTRAALYIGSKCSLMVFQSEDDGQEPLADYMRGTLKGTQGVYQPGTLRGDIVYRNAVDLGLHRLSEPDVDPRIPRAVDPFGAYQTLVTASAGPHAHLEYPLLFYTGVGVHVPDYREIGTDLPQLLAVRDEVMKDVRARI